MLNVSFTTSMNVMIGYLQQCQQLHAVSIGCGNVPGYYYYYSVKPAFVAQNDVRSWQARGW